MKVVTYANESGHVCKIIINQKMQPESYYYGLLILFKPWRNMEDLKGGLETFLFRLQCVKMSWY